MNTCKITAYIGLGSNLEDPLLQLKTARAAIASLAQVKEIAFSSFYQSPPMGPQDQPDYVNAVMAVATSLDALELLHCLQKIELEQGRIRNRRWGERTLDLDLLLYGHHQIQLPELIVPHVGMSERAFVLYPLQEIAPDLVIPNLGKIDLLVTHCPLAGLKKISMTAYSSSVPSSKALSILDLAAMKQRGEKITCLTAYDASFSALLDKAGIDVLLVGDSLGMVIQGAASTIPVTIEDMAYHCRCVTNTKQRAFVIADLPFLSYTTPGAAIKNAASLIQQGGAQMVKLEGAHPDIIRFLVEFGIPVCGHLGLLPQSIHQLGDYKVQGKEQVTADQILSDAQLLEQAGISLLVLECVPAALAKKISSLLKIPVIGIGAGVDCDGQVLVLYDMLGISSGKKPRFSKNFMQGADSIDTAITHYRDEVKKGLFPSNEHSY